MSINPATTNTSLKGKRKKALPQTANPLFIKWLTEWKQEAIEKGWKSSHTYSKALKTLKLFPLPLETGKDCRLLQNFGDKICKMLDEKLVEHRQNQANQGMTSAASSQSCSLSGSDTETLPGNSMSVSGHQNKNAKTSAGRAFNGDKMAVSNDQNSALASSTSVSVFRERTIAGSSTHSGTGSAVSANCPAISAERTDVSFKRNPSRQHDISDNSDSDGVTVPSSQRAKRVQKRSTSQGPRSREYVPAYRSGPYALILTLYRHMQDPAFVGYFRKSELSHAAQPLADKSFFIPEPGSHYTAWSSMGTLIKKGLVLKTSHPAKYSLTEAGYALGERLDGAETQEGSVTDTHQDTENDRFQRTTDKAVEQYNANSVQNDPPDTVSPGPDMDWQQNHRQSTEEEDLERALAESLLSYSQEISMRSVPSENSESVSELPKQSFVNDCSSKPSSNLWEGTLSVPCDFSENAVLILSDDEDDDELCVLGISQLSPAREPRRLHTLSPSPSSSPQPQHNQPEFQQMHTVSSSSAVESGTLGLVTAQRGEISSPAVARDSSPSVEHMKESKADVMEISDDSDSDRNVCQKQNVCDGYSSDELPDIGIPLSKRLLLRGNIKSNLLANSPASVTNVPSSSLVPASSTDVVSKNIVAPSSKGQSHAAEFCLTRQAKCLDSQVRSFATSTSRSECSSSQASKSVFQVEMHQASHPKNKDYNEFDFHRTDNLEFQAQHAADAQCKNVDSQSSLSSSASCSTSAVTTQLVPDFTLQPGSFDIILCLDNREFYGSKSSSKTLLPELMKSGIHCDLRLLHVGDLLWIARERTSGGSKGTQGRELVLHYIIERKRMDDLVSSIHDGRMKEQKFRLKHCGLSEPIILIEEYGSIQNFSISEETIKQSIVNSRIIDGFKIKHCNSLKDAVSYLAVMTRFLNQYYKNKTLHAVSLDDHRKLKGQQLLEDREHYLMPFETFNEASVKHKDLTVKEIFAKQLIQIPGVSADRARAITNVYPSITALMEAYRKCVSEKDKEKLVAGIKCGKKERNLGIAISRMLCLLYTQTGSLS